MPSTSFVTPTASNQPLSATLMAFSSPALGYAACIPSVHQAGISFQPSPVLPSNGFATQDLSNTTIGISFLTYLTYLTELSDLLGSLGVGALTVSVVSDCENSAQCAPVHTVCSLDQSCVIDTSLHAEPLEEGRFGPMGSAIPSVQDRKILWMRNSLATTLDRWVPLNLRTREINPEKSRKNEA
ncbi:hypothetical protein KIN20_014374 [Parelaphostrongylus tenuis]|uniref:Uncharacterized protein n=1 Tax=Parelaphostrongylus tenuis TaxID=148309 RepID=A0AAD5QPD1_PARTN|nr:hypothetical protein KIN20_014374 [Parelaphostrongylus tenuis]